MKLKTIRKIEKFINSLISGKFTSVTDFCSKRDLNRNTFQSWITALSNDEGPYQEESKNLLDKYRNFVNRRKIDMDDSLEEEFAPSIEDLECEADSDAPISLKEAEAIGREIVMEEEIDSDETSETSILRDDNGKVKGYRFKIYRKDKKPLIGILDREEMNLIYRLYSYYGSNLTQRHISRYFDYSLVDFKRILRAFQIFKACGPFAPHMYEEYDEDTLKNIQITYKEDDFVKQLEKNEIQDLRKMNLKLLSKVKELQDKKAILNELLRLDHPELMSKVLCKDTTSETDLIIWLSDLHVGAYNEPYGFYELPSYSYTDIMTRLEKVVETFSGKEYNRVIVVNLGDSLDSYNKETTRGGHPLPSATTDKENSKMYLQCMLEFFNLIKDNVEFNSLEYLCIGEANHDGSWGWINNIALSNLLEKEGIVCYVSDYPIDHFSVQESNFIFCHGKDDHNQFKQFPLTLNDKTELYFNNWIQATPLLNKNYKTYVVKGDLHNFAYTSGKTFDYVSVGSLYATSNYIAANFGNTPWSVNYFEINNNNVLIGKVQ